VIYVLIMYVLTGYGTSFYRDCSRLVVGMSRDEVQSLMKKYTANPAKFDYNEQNSWGNSMGWYTEGPLNDYQCDIGLDENGKVISVTPIFD
jgi:hypothetical protein